MGPRGSTAVAGTIAAVCNVMRPGFFLVLTAVLTPLFLSAECVHAAKEGNTRVTVRCSQPELVAGEAMRVFVLDSTTHELLPVDKQAKFDASGEAEVELAPGSYTFEVARVRDDGTIVAIQSKSISVPRSTSATIVAGKPRELTLSHQGQSLELSEVGVRSAGTIGEVRWRRKTSSAAPKVILTPGRSGSVNLIGSTESLHVAVWEKVVANANDAPIRIQPDSDCCNCRFVRRPGTPATRSVTATLVFPDTRLEVPVEATSRIVTNRRFLLMGYRMELDDGKCLQFEPLPCNVTRDQRFELGGAELTPSAWAAYVWEEDGAKWWPHLTWRVDLLDPGGHRLNIYQKNCGVSWTARRTDGNAIPNGRIDDNERKRVGEPARAIRVKLDWTWNGNQSREISPEAFVPLRSERFQIATVPAWAWQSCNYLSKLERYYRVLRAVTGRPGPASIKVDWRNNTHNAKAIIGRASGGGKDIWCSLPFQGYERNEDPFNEPWFMGHELLHTFGYGHGDEMTQLQKRVEFEFSRFRWYMVDNPRVMLDRPSAK